MSFPKFALSAWLSLAVIQIAMAAGSADKHEDEVLKFAEEVGHWLAANVNEEVSGISWPDDALNPETVGYDLAAGVSGKVLFFTALYNATGNALYLEYAESGADYLISVLQNASAFDDNRRRASLYSGISGIGVALINVQRVSIKQKYTDAANRIVELLGEWGIVENEELHWSDEFNDLVFGEAGTVLFLAYAAEQSGNKQALEMATSGARFLLRQAQPAEQGSYWYFRRDKPFNLPNFSHGTAGVGYVLAIVSTLTGERDFAQGARDAFIYLRSIAEWENGQIAMPYGWGRESWNGLYEFGWAHGLSGTALLVERLQHAGIRDKPAREMSLALRDTLLSINLPGVPSEPFAEPSTPLDMRFGRAGVFSLLSEWSRKDKTVTDSRDAIWSYIKSAAIRSERGVHWQVDAPEFMGGGKAAYTGYFHGASGIGLAILKLHASLTGRDPYIVMPDDPFSWHVDRR